MDMKEELFRELTISKKDMGKLLGLKKNEKVVYMYAYNKPWDNNLCVNIKVKK